MNHYREIKEDKYAYPDDDMFRKTINFYEDKEEMLLLYKELLFQKKLIKDGNVGAFLYINHVEKDD